LGRVDAVSFSADGRQVASFSADDGTIRLWDARDGAPSSQVDLPLAKRGGLAYTADSKASVVSYSGGVERRRSFSFPELSSIAAPQGLQSVAFSPDGKIMAFGFAADVFLVTVENGAVRWELSGDGRAAHLEVASEEAEMKLRRTVAGMKTRVASASKVRFSQDGKLLALVHHTDAQRSKVTIWDVAVRRQQHLIECEYAVRWVAFLNDGKRLAIAGDRDDDAGELCKIFELESFECLDSFPVPGASVCAAEFLRKGEVLLIAQRQPARSEAAGRLRLLEVSTHAALATLSTGSLTPTALAVSRDERRIAVGGLDGTTLIFETPRFELEKK
jgi:WD40 repeat protein